MSWCVNTPKRPSQNVASEPYANCIFMSMFKSLFGSEDKLDGTALANTLFRALSQSPNLRNIFCDSPQSQFSMGRTHVVALVSMHLIFRHIVNTHYKRNPSDADRAAIFNAMSDESRRLLSGCNYSPMPISEAFPKKEMQNLVVNFLQRRGKPDASANTLMDTPTIFSMMLIFFEPVFPNVLHAHGLAFENISVVTVERFSNCLSYFIQSGCFEEEMDFPSEMQSEFFGMSSFILGMVRSNIDINPIR